MYFHHDRNPCELIFTSMGGSEFYFLMEEANYYVLVRTSVRVFFPIEESYIYVQAVMLLEGFRWKLRWISELNIFYGIPKYFLRRKEVLPP